MNFQNESLMKYFSNLRMLGLLYNHNFSAAEVTKQSWLSAI